MGDINRLGFADGYFYEKLSKLIYLNPERLPPSGFPCFPPPLGRSSLHSTCLSFPHPQPAGVCRNQKESTCLIQSCLKSYIFTLFQDHLSFIRPKNGTYPTHQATGSLWPAALSEIDIHQLSGRTIPYIHTWTYILQYYLLFIFVGLPLPQVFF